METLSALDRVPIEIWHDIISFTLETWLLPGDGSNILDDIALFRGGCNSTTEYRRVERIRGHMRAVCRSWKAFLDSRGIDLTISDFQRSTVPSEAHLSHASRIEFPETWKCICKQCLYRFPGDSLKASSQFEKSTGYFSFDIIPFDSSFKPKRAQIILLYAAQRDVVDYLHHAPLLTAFLGKATLFWSNKADRVHSIFTRLTHLTIHDISTREMVVPLQLPRLRFLNIRLDLEGRMPPSEKYFPFESWVLPKLSSLILDGPVGGMHYTDLLKFLNNHSSTIENLVLQYYTMVDGLSQPINIDIRHLRQFPRLKVLGFSVMVLDEEYGKLDLEDEESTTLKLSLLLTDINDLYYRDHQKLLGSARRCLHLCNSSSSIFNKVIIPYSWDQLIQQWEAEEEQALEEEGLHIDMFRNALQFFNGICEANIAFFDRDGVGLRDEGGLKFLKALRQESL